jgi:hypothetical protein
LAAIDRRFHADDFNPIEGVGQNAGLSRCGNEEGARKGGPVFAPGRPAFCACGAGLNW